MIKIKPKTKIELITNVEEFKSKLDIELHKDEQMRSEITKILSSFGDLDRSFYREDKTVLSWYRICCEIGKLIQAFNDNDMYILLQKSHEKINELELKIEKLCQKSKDNPII